MRFWDSFALLPLFSEEKFSELAVELLEQGSGVVAWWGTWIECSVAISRLRRENKLTETGEEESRATLDELATDWLEIEPDADIRILAMLISKAHPPKAADCLQLAAALRWCEGDAEGASFVCLDRQLRWVAEEEGFSVLPESVEF